jgi:hypothetical protein
LKKGSAREWKPSLRQSWLAEIARAFESKTRVGSTSWSAGSSEKSPDWTALKHKKHGGDRP